MYRPEIAQKETWKS